MAPQGRATQPSPKPELKSFGVIYIYSIRLSDHPCSDIITYTNSETFWNNLIIVPKPISLDNSFFAKIMINISEAKARQKL